MKTSEGKNKKKKGERHTVVHKKNKTDVREWVQHDRH